MNNIIEEYLVKIGALADARSFQNAQNLINGLSGSLSKLGSILRYGGIIGMFAGLAKGIADQIKSVADLDMQYQKLAKDMWVTKETAKSLSIIKDVMKASENDIAFIPELREQFVRLRAEMQALATPPDADEQLKWIRSLGYEVESLQIKLKMFREWLVYYLIKYLGPYIKQIQEFLQWLNGQFGEKIAIWANKLAYIMARIVGLLVSAGRAVKYVVGGLWDFFDSLPEKTKKMVTLFAAAGAAIMMSPFGMLLVAIGGAMLLLEDFFYFLDGKKSSRTLAPMWAALIKFANGTGASWLEGIKTAISDIADILRDVIENLRITEVVTTVAVCVASIVDGIYELVEGFGALFKKIGVGKTETKSFFRGLVDGVTDAVNALLQLGTLIGSIFKAIGQAMKGDWSGAKDTLKNLSFDKSSNSNPLNKLKGYSDDGMSNSEKLADKSDKIANRARQKETLDVIKTIKSGVKEISDRLGSKRGSGSAKSNGFVAAPNELAREAAEAARWVEQQTGVSAELVYAQWALESGNFSSQLAKENINLGGLTQSEWNGDENKQPDGTNYYKVYGSVKEYAQDYVKSFLALYPELDGRKIDSPEEFARILKDEGYYGADYDDYVAGIKSHLGELPTVYHADPSVFTFKGGINPESYAARPQAGTFDFATSGLVAGGSNNTNYNIGNIAVYSNDPRTAGQSVIEAIKQRCGSREGIVR